MPNVACVSGMPIQSGLLTELRTQMLHTQCYVAPTCRFTHRYKNYTAVKMNWLTVSTYPKAIDRSLLRLIFWLSFLYHRQNI